MAEPPPREFGKRKPVAAKVTAPPAPPVKRSGHVALLLMGTVAMGGGAYALMPRNSCEPASPGIAAPVSPGMAPSPQTTTNCSARGYSSGGSGGSGSSWSRRSSFFGGDSASSASSSGTASGSASVTRGGFGSFAHSFASHFGG
ncbi:MAG: hypothetical protein WDN50_14650 [Bradyrhizobium sp.]